MRAMPYGPPIALMWRGVAAAVKARPGAVLAIATAVFVLHVMLPPLVLAVARKPWTFFTFNPWLKRLPEYLVSAAPLEQKLDFLSRVALFWFSADGDYGAPEWGFAVDTTDVLRFATTSILIGVYWALWGQFRWGPRNGPQTPQRSGRPGKAVTSLETAVASLEMRARAPSWSGGVAGALVGVLGLSTGPCSVVGCGAPVLPVVGLAFAGLSSGTLALLSGLSRLASAVVLVGLLAGIAYLGWRVGPDGPSRHRVIAKARPAG